MDVAALKKSHHAATDARGCFTSLLSHVPLCGVMLDKHGRILFCNPHFLSLCGWNARELEGRLWKRCFNHPSAAELASRFSELIEEPPGPHSYESEITTRSGKLRCIRWSNVLLYEDSEPVMGSIGEDVTERSILQRELIHAAAKEQQLLQSELHDGLGQELFGISMSAGSLVQRLKRGTPIEISQLETLSGEASHAIDSCRRIARGLSPLSELQGGFVRALQVLADTPLDWSGPILKLTNIAAPALLNLSPDALEHVYRIAKEAVANALKHAAAKTISIKISANASAVTLEIIDDGIGIDPQAMTRDSIGLGLRLMRYRANLLHAQLYVGKYVRGGTRIRLICSNLQ